MKSLKIIYDFTKLDPLAARLALFPTVPRRSTITSYYLCEKAESAAGRGNATSLSNALQQRLFMPYGVYFGGRRL